MAKTIKISCKCSDSLPIDELKAFQGKLKTIDEESFNKLKASILKYGFSFPIFIWNKNILDGHQRFYAVQRLLDEGYELKDNALPVVWIEAKNAREAAEKLLLINSRYAKIDQQGFEIFIEDYDIKLEDINIVLDIPEIDLGLGNSEDYEGLTDPDEIPEVEEEPVTKPGDIWLLGDHRLMCGDSTKIEDVERLMGGEKINAVLTDPPYGQNQNGIPGDSPENIGNILEAIKILPIDNGIIVAFQSPRTFPNWLNECIRNGHIFERMIWLYKRAQNSYPWRGWLLTSEAILLTSIGDANWNDYHPYSHDCYMLNEVSNQINDDIGWHGSIKPAEVVIDIMKRVSPDLGLIYEPFSGSGTTIIAAQQTGRKCYAMEIDPHYVDVAVKRWEDFTGENARLESKSS